MEIKGKVFEVLEEKNGVSAKTGEQWRSRDYVLEQDSDSSSSFVRKAVFSVRGAKIDEFHLSVGEHVCVHFDINSSEYNGKWFTRLNAYRVDRIEEAAKQQAQPSVPTNSNEQSDLIF